MKKTFVVKLALAGTAGLAAALAAGTVSAADCSACHTMHNSQNNAPMRTTTSGGTNLAEPLPVLLLDTCVGCHSGTNATDPSLLTTTKQPKVNAIAGAPGYMNFGVAGNSLAGGDFWWVGAGGDAKGHNVLGIDGADAVLGNLPPGGGGIGSQLQCAGITGCHGNTVDSGIDALDGAHHAPHNNQQAMTAATATTVGTSFRYLLNVQGGEDTNWEWSAAANDHNQYVGFARNAATLQAGTLSNMCARCHGAFHNTANGSDTFGINENNNDFAAVGSWIRHPTDYAMGNTAGSQYASYAAYSLQAPVGRTVGTLNDGLTNVGDANHRIVLCVSCHRAHGSPYNDILRWNYSTMQVGTNVTTGCMSCHRGK